MIFHPADIISLASFVIFSFLMFIGLAAAFWRAAVSKKYFVTWLIYLLIFSAVVLSGAIAAKPFPLIPILFFSIFALYIWLVVSQLGLALTQKYSLAVLIGFQGFRLPLELILHQWAFTGTVPPTMTWTGQNWDILTGIISLAAIPFINKSRWLAWLVQILGFLLLLNVLRVVIMSSPFPFSWLLENPIQLAMYFPYALIGPLFVGPALFGHLLVFRKLAFKNAA